MKDYTFAERQQLAAVELSQMGFPGVFSVPRGQKFPPPSGVTGRRGVDADLDDTLAVLEDGTRQLAFRVPVGVVGIDIDGYKDEWASRRELEGRLGRLPRTWGVSSNGGYKSVTLLYLLPDGVELRGEASGSIDIIQHHHRYVTAPPSEHPSGSSYVWTYGAIPTARPPHVWQLPMLPAEWVDFLRVDDRNKQREYVKAENAGEVTPFVVDESETMCTRMRRTVSKGVEMMPGSQSAELTATRGRHASLLASAYAIASEGKKGHKGTAAAMARIRIAFLESTRGEGRAVEADRAIRDALSAVGGSRSSLCDCGRPRARKKSSGSFRRGWMKVGGM